MISPSTGHWYAGAGVGDGVGSTASAASGSGVAAAIAATGVGAGAASSCRRYPREPIPNTTSTPATEPYQPICRQFRALTFSRICAVICFI